MNQTQTQHIRALLVELKDALVQLASPMISAALAMPLPKLLGWCVIGALIIALLPLALVLFAIFLMLKVLLVTVAMAKSHSAQPETPAQLNHFAGATSNESSKRDAS